VRVGWAAGTRKWHAPFRRVTELAAGTAGSTRSPSRDVRATPQPRTGKGWHGHRRDDALDHGRSRHASGHPCGGGARPERRVLGVAAFPATRWGYCSLSSWLGEFGTIGRVGVEGTGAYGAGVARHLRGLGVEVIEVDRPNRQLRRAQGKSDTIDAIDAARAVLSGRATGVAKTADGNVEAMRALLIAKRSGREARITCLNQVRHLGFTAPDELRERFGRVSRGMLAAQAAALRPRPDSDAVIYATKLAMRSLGRRVLGIDEEIAQLEVVLGELVTATAPGLVGLYGVGVDTAAILCVAAGDNPQRVRSEAAWAHLCGVAPLEATSGKVTRRHRLNRGGNRQANHALWRIVFTRLGSDPRTRTYVARRLDEGRSRPEIIRILKRYVARETYRHLPR
jgi:transposase